jgi:hypothetical protein
VKIKRCTYPGCTRILKGGIDTYGPAGQEMCYAHWQADQDQAEAIKAEMDALWTDAAGELPMARLPGMEMGGGA